MHDSGTGPHRRNGQVQSLTNKTRSHPVIPRSREKCDFLAVANREGGRLTDVPALAGGRNHNNINQRDGETPLYSLSGHARANVCVYSRTSRPSPGASCSFLKSASDVAAKPQLSLPRDQLFFRVQSYKCQPGDYMSLI